MIWEDCEGQQQIASIQGTLYRLVESQEQIATLGYVDTLEEQALLEDMLEQLKPPYPNDSSEYHYLLKTPFRYPPLKWGSRFGSTREPGIFYAAKSPDATLAESAYYRFIFWSSIDAPPIKDNIRTEHSLFSVRYKSRKGVQLQVEPFADFKDKLTSTSSYAECQQLGHDMRKAGVEAFEYESARDFRNGTCVALFTPNAFAEKQPQDLSRWLCETSAKEVAFKQLSSRKVNIYPIDMFLVDGVLPKPA